MTPRPSDETYAPEILALIDETNAQWDALSGEQRLWRWFGLSRASWLTLPRVLMHDMPPEWQDKMARLLEEFDDTFDWIDDFQCWVQAKRGNRFIPLPESLCNYRHPRDIEQYRRVKT
ncbi:MAG: hypothetical protein FD152_772 [Xanthobacteraceae bacterium]|nr:MAG: hypothetical protein FD152_772 [Xanthobacteraceae bacterium]